MEDINFSKQIINDEIIGPFNELDYLQVLPNAKEFISKELLDHPLNAYKNYNLSDCEDLWAMHNSPLNVENNFEGGFPFVCSKNGKQSIKFIFNDGEIKEESRIAWSMTAAILFV